jgi:hypothetical protein
MQMVPYPEELSPVLPTVVGNVEYQEFRATLLRIDSILDRGRIEQSFIEDRVEAYVKEREQGGRSLEAVSPKELQRVGMHASRALRCNIARELLGESYREFTTRLADSFLLQHFCRIARLDVIQVPSKSTLDRYDKIADEEVIRKVVNHVNACAAAKGEEGIQPLDLRQPLDVKDYFVDTTCVQAPIHFPVDWVLFRDAARSLIRAIVVIRKHGLRHRMPTPETFLRQMNRLSIEMTQVSGKKKQSKKERKRVLRQMKRLAQVIQAHATRYRQLLLDRRAETDLSPAQAQQIVQRIETVLTQLPDAMRQAHERIIRGARVPNAEKVLSFYERDVHVIVRGKAGASVEFGNTLFLGEQAQGVIVDWKLFKDHVPTDSHLVVDTLERFEQVFGLPPEAVAGDRGFDSGLNTELLSVRNIFNGLCPRNPRRLAEKMAEQRFATLQRRRAQTEARVGIFKNGFLGKPMRSKGFLNRERNVAWAVLAHNLWVIARLPVAKQEREFDLAA